MEISELTGLPELTEDCFWRVSEVKGESFHGLMWGRTPGAYLSIIRTKKVEKTRDKMIRLPFGMEFAWGSETYFEEEEETVISDGIWKKELEDVDVYSDDDDAPERIGVKEVEYTRRVSADDLTPELILETARLLLESLKLRNKARGYLGDYPPKHLDRPELENN